MRVVIPKTVRNSDSRNQLTKIKKPMKSTSRFLIAHGLPFGLLIPVALLSGCATPVTSEGPSVASQRHLVDKNYTIGLQMTVNIGEPLVKFQDYWVETTESPVATPDRTVNLKTGALNFTLGAGKKYQVRGHNVRDGVDYTLVEIDDVQHWVVFVGPDGTLLDHLGMQFSVNDVNAAPQHLKISDSSMRMLRVSTETVNPKPGYENYELVYTGTNAAGLNVTYREFSPEGVARVAFYQNVTYEAGAKNITFKKYRIAIDHATSESITFTVLADGK